jgi:preprotein translocase subunit Sss1
MAKKQKSIRNRARDMVGDYYLSNRQVEKENRERQQTRKEWSTSEKVLLVIIILGVVGLIIKYVVLG